MELNDTHRKKVDKLLEEVLQSAKGDEWLQVLVELVSQNKEILEEEDKLEPSQFSSWQDFRRASIEQMEITNKNNLEDILTELENLNLTTKGGKYSETVIVEGKANHVLDSLELPSIVRATIDRPIVIEKPRKGIFNFIREAF